MNSNKNYLRNHDKDSIWNVSVMNMSWVHLLILELSLLFLLILTTLLADGTALAAPLSGILSFLMGFFVLLFILSKTVYQQHAVSAASSKPAAKEKMPDLPELPVRAHPEYIKRLSTLKLISQKAHKKLPEIESFVTSCFEGSNLTISRYNSILADAVRVLDKNTKKAEQAVRMFGSDSTPTPDRLEILDRYVSDSLDLETKMNRIIDEMLRMQQKAAFDDSDKLDTLLGSLAKTTQTLNVSSGR